jgi:hypothetical protein
VKLNLRAPKRLRPSAERPPVLLAAPVAMRQSASALCLLDLPDGVLCKVLLCLDDPSALAGTCR